MIKISKWLAYLFSAVAIISVLQTAYSNENKPKNPISISLAAQLFVDDWMIGSRTGVKRTLHQARRLEKPVIVPDKPWEGQRIYIYGTVHFDSKSKLYRMWYMTRLGPGYEHRVPGLERHGDMILYATSKDGLNWEKPNLGLHEFDGNRDNNILMLNFHCPSVLIEGDGQPDELYKMMAWNWNQNKYGYWVARSADGLAWKEYPTNPVLMPTRELLEVIMLARDPRTKEYLAFHRRWAQIGNHKRRVIAVATSRDFQKWSSPELIIVPDKLDDEWVRNSDQRTEFYNLSGFWYGEQLLGLLPVFQIKITNKPSVSGTNQSPWDGPLHVQLVHSRDKHKWVRFEDRSPIIQQGPPGGYDTGAILGLANTPIIHNDEIWMYYTAVNTTHGGSMPPKQLTIGRASWRLDGFVSLDAGPSGGVVETVPLRTTGNKLEVNADASHGTLAVEVLSANGEPLPGYSLKESTAIHSDGVRHLISWKGRSQLKLGQPVRLRFHLKNTKLYSFRIV